MSIHQATTFKELGDLYLKFHAAILDKGCKSSCGAFEYGSRKYIDYHYEEDHYYFRFGGYCIGDCSRWHEIKGKTEREVVYETLLLFHESSKNEDLDPSFEGIRKPLKIEFKNVKVPGVY